MTKILPFRVIDETINGIAEYKYTILLSCLNFSNKYTIQGNKAKAKISGFKTNLMAIEGGKKLTNIKVIRIVFLENLKNLKRR
jgi:hypothetical protein